MSTALLDAASNWDRRAEMKERQARLPGTPDDVAKAMREKAADCRRLANDARKAARRKGR